MLRDGKFSPKVLERMIGKMVRSSLIMPGSQAFIPHFRALLRSCRSQVIVLGEFSKTKLRFWSELFRVAGNGTKIANLVMRVPTIIFFTDAEAKGLGGLCQNTGKGWRFRLPVGILSKTTINHLGFLAHLVSLSDRRQ